MSKVSFFTKTGGGEMSGSLNGYILKISKEFEKSENTINVEPAIQIHIEIRIDGDVITYGDPAGCSHLKFFKKKDVIANSIAVTNKELSSVAKARSFLKENIIIAFTQIADRLMKEKYKVDKEKFLQNVAAILSKAD